VQSDFHTTKIFSQPLQPGKRTIDKAGSNSQQFNFKKQTVKRCKGWQLAKAQGR